MPITALLMPACADGDGRSQPPPARPTGPGEVVVQVMVAGGFVPLEAAVTALPTITVLGDGTTITPAPTIAIYPGPAIAPLQATRLEPRAVDELVQRAADLGLLAGPLEFGRPPVADAPDTIVTINAGGQTHRHSANALGINDGVDPSGPRGVSQREAANRRALQELVDATQRLPAGEEPWKPAAVAVYVLGDYQAEPDLPQPQVLWPLAQPPATTGASYPCTMITGAETDRLLDILPRANARTPWVVDGRLLSLAFRPVVPGQPGCPED